MIATLRKRVHKNPYQSMGEMAIELNISKSSICITAKEDLRLKAYKRQPRQIISVASKKK